MSLFIKKLMVVIGIPLLLILLPAFLIDPYNVFHWKNVRDNGIEPNRNYIKMRYLLSEPEKYNALLFGSSRVGAIHVDKFSGVKAYNMTCSFGLPVMHLHNLQSLLDSGLKFNKIYIGVDDLCVLRDEKSNRMFYRCPYEYLKDNPVFFLKLYTNPIQVWSSLEVYHEGKNIGGKQMYKDGWTTDYYCESTFDWQKELNKPWKKSIISSDYLRNNMTVTLQSLEEIKELCEKNKIELIVFTNPLYKTAFLESINYGYLDFLKKMVRITPFYNFSGLNDITLNYNNFLDNAHYKAEVGDMIIRTLETDKNVTFNNMESGDLYRQGFGQYVTTENIDELIRKIDVN